MVSRQPKQRKLSELSRIRPDEQELHELRDLLTSSQESDRGVALIAGALVEAGLETAIAANFADCGPVTRKDWFEGSGAPLATFDQKIKIGRALGIYGPKTETCLRKVKDIRNAFAHALRPLSFKNDTIVSACRGLEDLALPDEEDGMAPARIRYLASSLVLFGQLIDEANRQGGKEIVVHLP